MRVDKFDAGRIHDEQRARLGIDYIDHHGDYWTYAKINEAWKPGSVVRAAKAADMLTTNPIVVTAISPIKDDKIRTTNGFVKNNVEVNCRGAIGIISAGGGINQNFYIVKNDKNIAQVYVLTSSVMWRSKSGWAVALNTASRVTLAFPGWAMQGDGYSSDDIVIGVAQVEAVAADIGKYCWLKRTGISPILVDGNGQALGEGAEFIGVANGEVAGLPSTDDADATVSALGRMLYDISGSGSQLGMAILNIPASGPSYNMANTENGYNEVVVR